MADAIANVRITAQDEASASIRAVGDALQELETAASASGENLTDAADGMREVSDAAESSGTSTGRFVITLGDVIDIAGRVKNAVLGAVRTLIDWANEAGKAELVTRRIETSLREYGVAAQSVTQELLDFADAQARVTTASDDTIKSGIALIAAFTKDIDQIKLATQAALDFSAATGVDLTTAFSIFAKAAEGNTGALSRYGIQVDENLTKSQKFADALAQVNEKMGGAAVAQVATYSGQVAQLGKSFDELKEAIGRTVTESDTVNGSISALTRSIEALTSFIDLGSVSSIDELNASMGVTTAEQARLNAELVASIPLFGSMLRATESLDTSTVSLSTSLGLCTDAAGGEVDVFREAEQAAIALAKANAEVAQRAKEAADILTTLGVTSLAESAKQASGLHDQLRLLEQAYADGTLKAQDFAAAQAAINARLAEIPGTIENTIRLIDEEAAAHQKLIDQWDAEEEAASRAAAAIDETTDALDRNAASAEKAATGWLSFTQSRSSDPRTDVQIAQDNLDAIKLLGPFASSPEGVGSLGARQAAERALAAAKARETAGADGAGTTAPLQISPAGLLAGGKRTLDRTGRL